MLTSTAVSGTRFAGGVPILKFLCQISNLSPLLATTIMSTVLVSIRYRPSNRRLSAKLLLTSADIECHVVSVTDPYGHTLGSLDRPQNTI
jgi:hypothetical protein